MDWRTLIAEAELATTMAEDAAAQYLAEIETSDPDRAERVRALSRSAGQSRVFMSTSAVGANRTVRASLEPGDSVGVWRIVDLIGAGGMGEVYRAERADGHYDQTVALKIMQREIGSERAAAFERERQRLAQLEDSGVSRIIDGGAADDGRPFMAMELVAGRPIDQYCEQENLKARERLALIVELSQTVGRAHAQLVLHRDIKAANVLVNAEGKTKLIDFGIAALLDDDDTLSAGPLTLATAAPEQLFGEPVSVATDIFAMGMLAHTLLTGDLPQRQADGGVQLAAIDGPGSKDLHAILAKATAFSPQDRYRSANALADDISAVLSHRPVTARNGGRFYRVGRFLRRYPVGVALASVAMIALLGGLTASTIMGIQARENLARAEFFLQDAQFTTRVQNTYSVILADYFDTQSDTERQTEILLQRWREAYDARDNDPEHAAIVSLVIGKHFSDRHDDQTARQVLEPLLQEQFGSDDVLSAARFVAGPMYGALGELDRAAELLRQNERAVAQGYKAYSLEHAGAAAWLAWVTEAPEDVEHAIEVSETFLDSGPDAQSMMTALSYLSVMYQITGDKEGSYQVARRNFAIASQNPIESEGDQNSITIRLAIMELYYKKDYDEAERILANILSDDARESAESEATGRALAISGDLALSRGELQEAERLLREALEVLERYSGVGGSAYLGTAMSLAETLAQAQRAEEAKTLIAAQYDALEEQNPDANPPRVIISHALVIAHTDGVAAATDFFHGSSFDAATLGNDVILASKHADLMALGVSPRPE